MQTPLQNPSTNVAAILKSRSVSNETLLSEADTAKVLSRLSHEAENLFADASDRLSLPALLQFLKNLCRASRDQLYRSSNSKKVNRVWWPARAWKQKSDSMPLALLLHRVGDVTLRVFRSSRPLLHILKVWAITGPHLMDVRSNMINLFKRSQFHETFDFRRRVIRTDQYQNELLNTSRIS